jgi:hypothetical protein
VFRSALPIGRGVLDTDGQILLVGKNQKNSISKLILIQHALQFLPSLNNTVTIIAVYDEDDTLGVLEVMSPQRSDLVLSTNIPYGELNVLVFDSLNIETWLVRSQLQVQVRPSGGVRIMQSYRLWEWL